MKISDVKIKLVKGATDKLLAFASITFEDEFVVRDLKVIHGNNGLFVAMPSRKLTNHCPRCNTKNHVRANHCNECGIRLPQTNVSQDDRKRAKLHTDIAHPINTRARDYIQNAIVEEYLRELELSKQTDYNPHSEDSQDAGPE